MFKLFLTLIFCFQISSCSTKWGSFFTSSKETDEEHEKLLSDFNVEEDVMKKFLEKEEADKEVKGPPVKKVEKTPKEIKKTVIKKKEVVKKEAPKIKKVETLPADYPDNLKEMNEITSKFWNDFSWRAKPGEKIYMDINYLGMTAGKIIINVKDNTKIGESDVYHVNARLKSAPFYRYIYELDDNIDSFISHKTNTPVKFSLIQRESSQDIDDLQLFDHDEKEVYWYWKRVIKKDEKKKTRKNYSPLRFQDPLSVIFFLRGLPLTNGSKYILPIVNKAKVELLTAEVIGLEKIKTQLGTQNAIKIKAYTKYSGETLKSGDMEFWFSEDPDHHFLKFKAKIKLGSISGDITKIE